MSSEEQLPKFIIFDSRKYRVIGYKKDKNSKSIKVDKNAVELELFEILDDSPPGTHPKIGSTITTLWPISHFIKHDKIY